MYKNKKNILKRKDGITLVALVITIIVLLILASISINMISGENSLINKAGDAKILTDIAEEKENIEKAVVQTIGHNKYGSLIESELQIQLNNDVGKGKTKVSDVGNCFEVEYIESKRYYEVDEDGNVSDNKEIILDDYSGDVTKGLDGTTLLGTAESPFEIWCIEDLCDYSNRVNNNQYRNSYVKVMRDLNFKSKYSYANGKIATEGNIASCNSIEDLKNNLTTGEGFFPIGINPNGWAYFGHFDGNNKKIDNLYINRADRCVGLIGYACKGAYIENIKISGNIIGDQAGGIVGYMSLNPENNGSAATIKNCENKATVFGNDVGGIVGRKHSSQGILKIINCKNTGIIGKNGEEYSKNNSGGIIGCAYTKVEILNCLNLGNIYGSGNTREAFATGGIAGTGGDGTSIYNSFNQGNVIGTGIAGGLLGTIGWRERYVINCYNSGYVKGDSYSGGIVGRILSSNEIFKTKNLFYLKSDDIRGLGDATDTFEAEEDVVGFQKGDDLITVMNSFIDNPKYIESDETETTIDTSEWKKWKLGEDGYPTFE